MRGYWYEANDELDDMTNSWRFPHKLITNDGIFDMPTLKDCALRSHR